MATKLKFSKEELKMPEEHFGPSVVDKKSSFMGIVLGLLILVLIVILGGLYLWAVEIQKRAAEVPPVETLRPSIEENNEPESNNAEADVETMQAMSTSDEIGAIEADLGSTNLDSVTSELNEIDAVVGQ